MSKYTRKEAEGQLDSAIADLVNRIKADLSALSITAIIHNDNETAEYWLDLVSEVEKAHERTKSIITIFREEHPEKETNNGN